jgi:cytochrome b561
LHPLWSFDRDRAHGCFSRLCAGDSFFGFFSFPGFDPGNRALRHNIAEVHETAANIILIPAEFRAAASLVRHYVWHGALLRRMVPGSN